MRTNKSSKFIMALLLVVLLATLITLPAYGQPKLQASPGGYHGHQATTMAMAENKPISLFNWLAADMRFRTFLYIESLEPDWRSLDAELLQGWRNVPAWVFP